MLEFVSLALHGTDPLIRTLSCDQNLRDDGTTIHNIMDECKGFPNLPLRNYWSPNVIHAHDILKEAYQQALRLLQQEDWDPLRLRIHSDQLNHQMVPLLAALHHEIGDVNWIELCAHCLGKLVRDLEEAAHTMEGQ